MLPSEGDGLTGEESGEKMDALIEQGGERSSICRLAGRAEAGVVHVASPNAEDEAAIREVIEGDRLGGKLPWTTAGKRGDERAESNLRGGDCHRSQGDPGVEGRSTDLALIDDVVLEKDAIPSRVLSESRELRDLGWLVDCA